VSNILSDGLRFPKFLLRLLVQKMVAELESVLKQASTSPEAMWRSRILMRSAQDAQWDLQQRVHQQTDWTTTTTSKKNSSTSTTTTTTNKALVLAQEKLRRDWNRTRQQFHNMVMESQQRQLAEMSLLSAKNGDLLLQQQPQPEDLHHRNQEEKEDFFDRAMRERQEEIQRISQSMKTINEIYTVRFRGKVEVMHNVVCCM
jgi:hypothetical protein